MMHRLLEERVQHAVAEVLPDVDLSVVQVRPCPDAKFGDYQSNSLMAIAKARKLNPRQLAEQVKARLDVATWCDSVDIAGAGFLNFRLRLDALAGHLAAAGRGEHLFFATTTTPRTVVIDFSSPNVAKPMHIGHIRSTALGDALARTYRLLGHHVVTDNHIGDWGTQFGMLLVGWKTMMDPVVLEADPAAELERIYKAVNDKAKTDPSVLDHARQELVRLQQGDEENLRVWAEMIRLSQVQFDTMYARLGIRFDHTLGESFYNPRLLATVSDLLATGIARESDGAKAVFSDGTLPPGEDPFLIQRDGEWNPNPQLIQKSDGGFNYATTDLATLAYRWETWHPDEVIYVTDGRQQLHFQQLFSTFRRWKPAEAARMRLAHVWFGTILGEDGRPFKTRSGDTVKLGEVLNEVEERAFQVVTAKNPELEEVRRREIARLVGIAAVKYADLLPNRQSDYIFSWDKMLALQGNTAVYLLYAYARLRGILRKAEPPFMGLAPDARPVLQAPDELALARQLLNFGFVLEAVAADHRPNFLCNYLYDLAGQMARFYESCPVLRADEPERSSRLLLCDLTARVLAAGLATLGIEVLDQL